MVIVQMQTSIHSSFDIQSANLRDSCYVNRLENNAKPHGRKWTGRGTTDSGCAVVRVEAVVRA